jgi:hypothetical protein
MRILSEQAAAQFQALPELGMGFQFVADEANEALLLNCRHVVAFDELSRAEVWAELRDLDNRDRSRDPRDSRQGLGETAAPWDEGVRLDNDSARFGAALAAAFTPLRLNPARYATPLHGSPPFFGQTTAPTSGFSRFSAFRNDRRRLPNGDVAGTYATSSGDAAMVPSGTAAVGRYALPSPMPAVFRSDFVVGPGVALRFGTVAPMFGQSGGGSEVEFVNGVASVQPRMVTISEY